MVLHPAPSTLFLALKLVPVSQAATQLLRPDIISVLDHLIRGPSVGRDLGFVWGVFKLPFKC